MLAEAYPAAPDIVQLSMLVAHELRDPSADYSFASLPAPDMGGLPPPGLSALSALPYVPRPATASAASTADTTTSPKDAEARDAPR